MEAMGLDDNGQRPNPDLVDEEDGPLGRDRRVWSFINGRRIANMKLDFLE